MAKTTGRRRHISSRWRFDSRDPEVFMTVTIVLLSRKSDTLGATSFSAPGATLVGDEENTPLGLRQD
jgi:hypothetical protein